MIQTISIKDTRNQLADLVNQVDIAGKEFIISKFGKPKAMLVPFKITATKQSTSGIDDSFGMWKDRKDIKDSAKWVSQMRKNWSKRT